MKQWFPLIMRERNQNEPMGASRIERGIEMNFGALTEHLFNILETKYDTKVQCNTEVIDVDPSKEDWCVIMKDLKSKKITKIEAEHVFIGAGGGSLLLLEKVEIPEKDGYGGFPISGKWLVCKNKEIINQHDAKVYSLAGVGDPPMSVPHLDTRYIKGKRELLFGPFAGFTMKFLKKGSALDLLHSLRLKNLHSMWGVFWHNLPLTKYLIDQVAMSFEDRMDALRVFIKDAKNEDWEILQSGKRVQTIKKSEFEGGKLEFGTEIVSSTCGKITCLLGASPGASTSVPIMMQVVEKAFPKILSSKKGQEVMGKMIPAWGKPLTKESFVANLKKSEKALQL